MNTENTPAITPFLKRIEQAAKLFEQDLKNEVLLLHHNDTDGLTSAAILLKAFERKGIPCRSYTLEKPYPTVLRHIFRDPYLSEDVLILFADFGSGMLEEIRSTNSVGRPVYLLDHHTIDVTGHHGVQLVNPLLDDISGSYACSAAPICALFACALSPYNEDLLGLGLLGAFGDSHHKGDEGFRGVDRHVLERALALGLVTSNGAYHFQIGASHSGDDLKRWIDTLGSVGYLFGGPDIAIKGLQEGFDERHIHHADEFRKKYHSATEEFFDGFSFHHKPHLQWFTLPESFSEMGVKTVGLICEELKNHPDTDPEKYILGFQPIPDRIPGIGTFSFHSYKLSMRLPDSLTDKVKNRAAPSLADILPPATQSVGGFVDACHEQAAATTIPTFSQESFLEELEKQASEK